MIDMTPKEEAKKLLESFSKVKNMVYSTVKDRIIKNVIVQNPKSNKNYKFVSNTFKTRNKCITTNKLKKHKQ
jgi:hypothetical protein